MTGGRFTGAAGGGEAEFTVSPRVWREGRGGVDDGDGPGRLLLWTVVIDRERGREGMKQGRYSVRKTRH